MTRCHGAVRMCQVLVLSILASEATAFLISPLGYMQINRLQSPQSFAHKPALLWTKKRTRTNGLQLRMEHIGRRYFLWRFAEWAFEKVMVFAQISITLVYNFIKRFQNSAQIDRRMYDLRYPTYKSVKAASGTDKAHLASRAESSPQMTPKASAPSLAGVEHSTNQGKTILSFVLLIFPIVTMFASMLVEERNIHVYAQSISWLCLCLLFVDFASGSSSGLTIFVRKRLPMSVRRLLAFPRPWIYENKLGSKKKYLSRTEL
mmetsp:Transcript_44306/g.139801  ORF Transcript_44306/g.139801 Transcript_44306/m.139801 type:complete len:261 (+) Transcript_44306:261-1043(+)